jgi:tRNA G18 (ribose-2'-O)-methylase SpoU
MFETSIEVYYKQMNNQIEFGQSFTPDLGTDIEDAFVFGNEVFGVNDAWIQEADFSLEIPQFGTKHSLNVSVSMGVVIWDFVSKIIA